MDNRKSTGFYIIITIMTKMIVLFGGFIISILLARLLGAQGKGVVTALFVVPNIIISIADLGVRQASAYYIGQKIYTVKEVLSSIYLLWIITSILSIFIAYLYFSTGYVYEYGWLLISIALLFIPIKLMATYLSGIAQGLQKIGTININSLIGFFTNITGVIFLVWLLDLSIIGASIVTLLVALSGLLYFLITISKISRMKLEYIKEIPQQLFSKGIKFALALFILTLNYKIDILFLENMVSSSQVGIYSVGTNLAELIWQIPAAIAIVLFSRSANSSNDQEAHTRSAMLLRITLPFILIICLIFYAISGVIVPIIYGHEFQESANVINVLLPGVFIIVISKILHPDMAARGYPLYGLFVFIVPLILNILLNIALIPSYGIIGAAWASTISYSVGGITYGIVYSKKVKLRLFQLLIINKKDIQMLIKKLKILLKKIKV